MREKRAEAFLVAMFAVISAPALGGCAGAALVADMLPMVPDIANVAGALTPPPAELNFEKSNPLIAATERAAAVKTIVVGPPLEKATSAKEVVYLAEGLAKSGRFKVLSPSALAQKTAESKSNLGLMTGSEKIEFLREAGRTLGADALMVLSSEEIQARFGAQILLGRGSIEGKNRLRVYAIDSGELIWEQVQRVKVTVGAYSTPQRADALLRAQFDPLIEHFVKSFGPGSVATSP